MARYEVKLRRHLRVDTETLAAGTVVARIECDLPIRMVASLILNRGIVVGEQQVDVVEPDKPNRDSAGRVRDAASDQNADVPAIPKYAVPLFAAENVHTVDEAKAYYAKHGSFEPINGLGEKRCKQLAQLFGLIDA